MRAIFLALLCACSSPPSGPPSPGALSLEVTSPAPGDELVAADHPTITVTGTVATTNPDYGVLEAWVDGAPAALGSDGTFSADVTPDLGINHIKVEAADGYGDTVTRELDVMWAPDYLPPTPTGYSLAGGLALDLGQGFFDGRLYGTTLDMTTDPVVAHDLASALELILWNIDLASLVSGGIHEGTGSSTLDIDLPSATPSEILVDAKILDPDAIELDVDLNGVYLATQGNLHINNRDLVVAGGLSADMHASAKLALAVAQDGTISVTATNVTAVVGPLVPMFTGPNADELDGFINVGGNDFRTLVQTMIQDQLIPTFTNRIPPLLEALLGATDKLLDHVSFTLDPGLGTAVTLMLNGTVGALDVVPGPAIGETPGHVTVQQTVAIQASGTSVHPTSRGAARVAMAPVVPPTNTSTLHVLLQDDFINALLHAFWSAGGLDGMTSVGGITAVVSAKLQPFVRPTPDASACQLDGVRCDVIVQLGQLEISLPDFSQSFAIDATAGARVIVDGTTVSLVVEQTPAITVWETSAEPGRFTPAAIHDLIANLVWPQLFGAIGDKLKITLPIPDLAMLGLDALSPKLANAKLELDVRQRAAVTPGYLGLGADLQLQTPHP